MDSKVDPLREEWLRGSLRPGQSGGNIKQNLLTEFFGQRLPCLAPLAHLIGQDDLRHPVLIFRIGVLEIGVGLLKFRLAEFHN